VEIQKAWFYMPVYFKSSVMWKTGSTDKN